MIDEKRLIEEINEKLCADCSECYGHCEIRLIEGIINEQPKVGEWISVSERLPEDETEVFVTLFGGCIEIGWFELEERIWRTDEYDCDEGTVLAWMPLPEPYKEDAI